MQNKNIITSPLSALVLALFSSLSLAGCVSSQEEIEDENIVILDDRNMSVVNKVVVFKDAMKKQCFGDGIALDKMEKTLNIAGIEVFCAERHKDGMVYPQVCGNDEGTVNVFSIAESDLESAKTLGFSPINNLTQANITSACLNLKKQKK